MNNKNQILQEMLLTVNEGMCHRCGTCVGMCPTGAITFAPDGFPKVNSDVCVACGTCLKVCSGREFNCNLFTQELHPGKHYKFNNTHGFFLHADLACSSDDEIRQLGSSGGVITQILISLLESKEIDGAIVVTSDEKELWKGKPIIARSVDEIISAAKSKYAITSTNSVLAEIRKSSGHYVAVGLPCQIQGLRKAMQLDKSLKEKIVLTIGLFCHSALDPAVYREIWKTLGPKADKVKSYNPRAGKHPGIPTLEFKDGTSEPLFFPDREGYQPNSTEMLNVFFRLYTQQRCFYCVDALSEYADISVGDPYMPKVQGIDFKDGWSFVLSRTEIGQKVLKAVADVGDITLRELSFENTFGCNYKMAHEKKNRALNMLWKRFDAKGVAPVYANLGEIPRLGKFDTFTTELNLFTHWFCLYTYKREKILSLMLGNLGYNLLKLNNKRKNLFK